MSKPWLHSQPPLHSDYKENMEIDTVVFVEEFVQFLEYGNSNMKRSNTHEITIFFFHQHQIAYQAVL